MLKTLYTLVSPRVQILQTVEHSNPKMGCLHHFLGAHVGMLTSPADELPFAHQIC